MVHSLSLGDDPTKERNIREGKKKRRNEERHEGPYRGGGTRELVVALVPERKQTNKKRKAQTVTSPSSL